MMTEQEMRNRMKEIDNERNMLRKEREEYEKYFSDKRIKEQLDNHKQYVGKCFLSIKFLIVSLSSPNVFSSKEAEFTSLS